MLTLSSEAAALDAVAGGRCVELDAYTLGSRALIEALAAAAKRGAAVRVRLAEDPYRSDGLARLNRQTVARLREDGIDARLVCGEHVKALSVDGVAFYDDCNWRAGGGDTVLRDDVPDDPAVARTKGAALALERGLIAGAGSGDAIAVETESFGNGPVSGELAAAARRGAHVRLLVGARELRGNVREAAAIASMRRAGVAVRTTDATEKFALAPDGIWIGSANATYGALEQSDWGTLGAAAARDRCDASFEARWKAAGRERDVPT